MSTIIKAPGELFGLEQRIFLAGSIEMGAAEDWQVKIENLFKDAENTVILNPRRDDWDSSWVQSIEDPQFYEQVTWELDAMKIADLILMYFSPETKSPITLLELGLNATSKKLVVCCPDGFWRKGNVEIVCADHNIPLFDDFEEFSEFITNNLIGVL